jgi:hypothetical protein
VQLAVRGLELSSVLAEVSDAAPTSAGGGLIDGGIRWKEQRDSRFQYDYQACMRGDLR